MRRLSRVVRSQHDHLELPEVFPSFTAAGVSFRPSELHMIAGQPGAGKSALALTLALGWGEHGIYVSADTSEATVVARTLAMIQREPVADMDRLMLTDPDRAAEILGLVDWLRWSFPDSPSVYGLDLEIAAFEEVYGTPPGVIVVDNLMDMSSESDHSSWTAVLRDLKGIARSTGAAVIVLHHTSEMEQQEAPSRRSVQGKVSQIPALILTVGGTSEGLAVGVVKNRFGPQDPTATRPLRFRADFSRMSIWESPYTGIN